MQFKTVRTQRRKSRRTASRNRAYIEALEARSLFSGVPIAGAVPALHSNPTATAKIYLDFTGDPATVWVGATVPVTPAYDIDSDPTTFSTTELANIQQIWARVSEAFSPFNVDVTTVDPGNYTNGMKVIIGGDGLWMGNSVRGASAYGAFYNPDYPNTAYVFPPNLFNGDPAMVSQDVAFELGKSFGLYYLYQLNGKFPVVNRGNSQVAPFMGDPMFAQRATWWQGYDPTTKTNVDDIAVIAGPNTGFGFHADLQGDSISTASALSGSGTLNASGIIEQTTDSDFFSFTTGGGQVTIAAKNAQYGGMLDVKFQLFDSSGQQVVLADSTSLNETWTGTLAAGTYYVGVSGHGMIPEYDSTGLFIGNAEDVGQFTLTLTLPSTGPSVPSQVSGLVATPNTGQIALTWNAVSGASSYNVYASATSGAETLVASGITGTSWTNTGLGSSTTRYFKVAAVNTAGTGALSIEASATTPPAAQPSLAAQVTGLNATPSTGQIALTWNAASGALTYNVYASATSGTETLIASGITGTSWTNTGLGDSATRFYKVAAVNTAGIGALSTEASATTPAPAPVLPGQVTGLNASPDTGEITLTWNAASGALSYNVYAASTSGSEFLVANIAGTSWTNSGLGDSVTRFYKVAAVNTAGIGTLSAEVSATTPAAVPTGPAQVTGLVASAADGEIYLAWNNVSVADSYNIYWSATSGAETLLVSGVVGNSFSLSGITEGVTRYFKVAAVNASGTGALSAEAYATTPITTTVAPARVTGLIAQGAVSQVNLAWNPVVGATSYSVYRSTASGAEVLIKSGITGTSWSNAGLTGGTTYYYTVCAMNAAGTGAQSPEISITTLTTLPGTVSGLTANAVGPKVYLSWNATSYASSYQVYRGTSPGAETLYASNVTSRTFVDSGAATNVRYYYKIVAVNANGTSGMSAEVNARPLATVTSFLPTNTTGKVTLDWSYPISSGFTGFKILYTLDGGSTWQTLTTVSATTRTYTHVVASGTSIGYRICAIDVNAQSSLNGTGTFIVR